MLGSILHSHYKIVKILGIGKSGMTYLATDLDSIDSPLFVIKQIQHVPSSGVMPQVAEKLFEIQSGIAYQVGQHPQIPALMTTFEEAGERFLVREYIDGEFLSQELTAGATWTQTQVFDFLFDLTEILGFVHNFKYIHQDINPHNIIRRHDGRFCLIGFSSVKDLGSTWPNLVEEDSRHINDPSYTPYEQEQGVSKLNSDIYAVGAIAIQAIVGKFPLEKDGYTYELKWRDEANINQKLADIIHKMVRPDYRNRYQSAPEVLQALKTFALTQIPAPKSLRFQPQLIFGMAVCGLTLGFSAIKLFSASANKPQVTPSPIVAGISSTTGRDRADWQQYTDKAAKLKVKYASNWQQQKIDNIVTGERVIFTAPASTSGNKYPANISIRVENLTNPRITLAQYTQSTIAEIDRYYKDAKFIESSSTKLAKRLANLVVFTGKDENSAIVKNLEVWTISRGKAYILTYKAAPDRYYESLGKAMTAIESFALIP
jgi:eukaryotic-like serine/threonine-protein kinase